MFIKIKSSKNILKWKLIPSDHEKKTVPQFQKEKVTQFNFLNSTQINTLICVCKGNFSASFPTGSGSLHPPCCYGKVFKLFSQICLLGLFSASRSHLSNICCGRTTHLVLFTHTSSHNTGQTIQIFKQDTWFDSWGKLPTAMTGNINIDSLSVKWHYASGMKHGCV